MMDLIDRFWLFRKATPALLALCGLLLVCIALAGWWAGWAVGNHMAGAGLAAGLSWALGVWWGRFEVRHQRPRD